MTMLALHELQARFTDSLFAIEDLTLLDLVDGDGLDARAGLAVYRHHVLTTLTATLAAAYPVVCRLVDRRFFAYAADAFIRGHLPTEPCLAEYGAGFPDFLASFPACGSLPYLPDVARLEWAVHTAAQHSDAASLDLARLRRVEPRDMAQLRFVPDPSVALLASPWPVDKIWQAHQEGTIEALPDIQGGVVCLQVHVVGETVAMRVLEPATFAFRDALARGLTLGEAAGLALESNPSFDLQQAIVELLGDCIFNDFTIVTEEGA
jgi:Putative DNA-binding domain